MKKQRKKKLFKKPLAAVLAAAMVLSGIQDSRVYALASEVNALENGQPETFNVYDYSDFLELPSSIQEVDKPETSSITINIMEDIDLTDVAGWRPININTPSIQLVVEGNGYAVKGLKVESESDNVGIFGQLNCSVTIESIDFVGIEVTAKGKNVENVGTVAGKITSDDIDFSNINVIQPKIENQDNSGTTNVGGVVGYLSSQRGALYGVGVYNNNEETAGNNDGEGVGVIQGTNCVGGIVGRMDAGEMNKCVNHVSVTGAAEYVGGLVGYLGTDKVDAEADNAHTYNAYIYASDNYGNVTGDKNVGGVVGSIAKSGSCGDDTVTSNYGTVTGSENVGGIAGSNAGKISNDEDFSSVQNLGEVKGAEPGSYIGGVCGWNRNTGTIYNAKNYANVAGREDVGSIAGKNEGVIGGCQSGKENDVNKIKIDGNKNVGGIAGDNAGSVTKSTNNADVTGNKNVGGITGINSTADSKVMGCKNNGVVTGDALAENGVTVPSSNIGGITGENNGIISSLKDKNGNMIKDEDGNTIDCVNNGDVSGDNNVGGIAGINNGEIQEKCVNNGDVTGKENVGGIAGENQGNISDAENKGSVTGENNVGGIAGENDGTISSSINDGNVSGDNNVGGIAGSNNGDIKDNCVNNGDVTGKENVGGIAGENQGNISDATNTGDVTGDKNVGGLAGKNEGNISNSTNTGDVTGKDKDTTGGLVGVNETPNGDDSNITNSTNSGKVNGESGGKDVGQNVKKEETTPTQTPGGETENPGSTPSSTPSQGPDASASPSQEPDASTSPSQGPDASMSPSQAPNASTSPSQAPNASTGPNPSATPGVSAAPNASATPNANDVKYGTPSYNTGGTNVINYITNPTSATWDKQVRFGYIFTIGNYTYRITKSTLIGDAVNTVELYRVANRSLKTISIKNQVKLGTQAFNIVAIRNDVAKKYGPVKKVVIGDKVTKIGSRAFMGCKKLKSVNIDSKKLTKLGTNAFSGCKNLKKIVIVSSKVKSVGKNAFKNTSKKLVIDVPNKKAKAYKKVFAKSGKAKKAVIK